jgi:hypothetical protein
MAEIVRRISAAPNLQDATYEEVTKLSIAEFKGLVK